MANLHIQNLRILKLIANKKYTFLLNSFFFKKYLKNYYLISLFIILTIYIIFLIKLKLTLNLNIFLNFHFINIFYLLQIFLNFQNFVLKITIICTFYYQKFFILELFYKLQTLIFANQNFLKNLNIIIFENI